MSIFSKVKNRVKSTKLKVRAAAAGFVLVIASIAALATMGGAAASPSVTPDCDSNAAVWCGVTQSGTSLASEIAQVKKVYANGDGHNKYYTIQDMYNYFGMSTSVINGLSTSNVVSGYVTSSGDVYAGSTLVGTGAITAGRQNMTGSTSVKYGATTFYTRPTHVSFQNGELGALIIIKNGVFQNAILVSCGNPVKGTPKKPNYSITKQVATAANGTFGSNVTVKSGATVYYKVAVKSTGAIPVDNVTVHDTLPSGISYNSGTLQENGKAVSSSDAGKFFGTGLNVGTIKNGATDTFTFAAKAGTVAFDDTSCKPGDNLTNNGYVAAPGLSTLNASAKVSTTCAPPASLACTNLTAVAGTADATTGNQQYTFTAKANPQNVTITAYSFDFGDSNTTTVKSSAASVTTTHTYAPGSYTAKFTVTGTAAATSKTYTSSACTFSVNVKQAPKPNYSILKQVATAANGTFSDNVQVKSGATVYYKITVSSTGDAPVTNVNVKDALPTDVKYTTGTLKQDGTAVSASDASSFFGNGLVVASIKNGSSTVFTYSAVAGNTATDTDPSCKAETLDNTGTISTANLSNKQSKAEVTTTCTQLSGTLACVALQAIAGDVDSSTGNQSYTFKGTSTANNATVGNYTFVITNTDTHKVVTVPMTGPGLSVTTPAQTLTPGNYNVTLAVDGTDNYGKQVVAPSSASCAKTFTVAPPECKPGVQAGSSNCFTYTCNLFTVQVVDLTNRVVKVTGFNASSTNPNAATPTQVMVEWGDGTHDQAAYADATTLNHTFAADQKYTITAIGQFTTPDGTASVNSTACTAAVDFTLPPVMPNTGAGDVIGIFVGAVATATIAARLFLSRKLARR